MQPCTSIHLLRPPALSVCGPHASRQGTFKVCLGYLKHAGGTYQADSADLEHAACSSRSLVLGLRLSR